MIGLVSNPRLALAVGGETREATCLEPVQGNALVCRTTAADPKLMLAWTVAADDTDADGIAIPAGALQLGTAGIVTPGLESICNAGDTAATCDGWVDTASDALGPFAGHKVEGRALRVSVADAAAVVEGSAASFPVRLPYPAAGEVTVAWSSADGTAAAGADYTAVAGATLTIAAGRTAATLTVETLGDALDEDAERFTVILGTVTGAEGLDPAASVAAALVEDDDAVPAFTVTDARAVEGEETAQFEVTLSSASGRALALAWSSADGTATAGADYTAVAGAALTFAPGETRAVLTVQTLADADAGEGDETFTVTVARAAYGDETGTGQTVTATGTVVESASVPGAPGGLAATVAGARAIDLEWTAPASGAAVIGYRIEGSGDGVAWTVLVSDTGSTDTAWSETGLAPNTTRHYRVRGLAAGGVGPVSNVANEGPLPNTRWSASRSSRRPRRATRTRWGSRSWWRWSSIFRQFPLAPWLRMFTSLRRCCGFSSTARPARRGNA